MTPIIELDEVPLVAHEVMELVQQTKFSMVMEGMTLVLFTNNEDQLLVSLLPAVL